MPTATDPTPWLTEYASSRYGRPLDPQSTEVAEYRERLSRQDFINGFRTNPGGYYLDVIMTGLPGTSLTAKLKSPNDLMRMELEKEYRGYRNDWFRILDYAIPRNKRPPEPLGHARVMFQIFSNKSEKHLLDAEAKYSAVDPHLACLYPGAKRFTATKPLLDSLQGNATFSGSGKETVRRGLGVLRDDTDGEHFRAGVIRQLEVLQRRSSQAKVRLVIEEVPPWG